MISDIPKQVRVNCLLAKLVEYLIADQRNFLQIWFENSRHYHYYRNLVITYKC